MWNSGFALWGYGGDVIYVSLLSSPALLWLCADSAVSEAGPVGPETKTRLQTGAAHCWHGSWELIWDPRPYPTPPHLPPKKWTKIINWSTENELKWDYKSDESRWRVVNLPAWFRRLQCVTVSSHVLTFLKRDIKYHETKSRPSFLC